ncbi:HpsJ family protein [Spirulina subsalsa]|uniref:hormogonium polysaccharide biosynthesis protein HpsJ n=1 Tax=Spirulina subsalsa TaxID=54311 RepID=UPI000303A5F9|nr:HpsJ family protein [Spirulina subsalsa]
MNNSALSSLTALALKTIAVILIVSSLIDYVLLAYPLNLTDTGWQIGFTSQIVDRGIVPMVGIGLLVVASWISSAVDGQGSQISLLSLRFWAFLFASVMGLIFLLLVPLHISNLGQAQAQALSQITESATAAEGQIQSQFEQITQLLEDEQRIQELDQAIASGQVQGQQLEQLQTIRSQIQELRQNPDALQAQRESAETQLRTRRAEAEQQAKQNALKSGLRIGLSSVLLAIGYIVIGWTGFRSLLVGAGGGMGGKR